MAKRKITVTVDEELVDAVHGLGRQSLSKVVNDALAAHVERVQQQAALREMLDEWTERLGLVPEEMIADAVAAFDEAEGITGGEGAA